MSAVERAGTSIAAQERCDKYEKFFFCKKKTCAKRKKDMK
jgi:hypothetical protein